MVPGTHLVLLLNETYFFFFIIIKLSYFFHLVHSIMKVHLIATTNKTIKTMNPHDAKMEMLMEENSRLRRQLEAFMKEKNDDIENVFRNKLDHVRSSSRSIKKKDSKTNLSPRPVQALQ